MKKFLSMIVLASIVVACSDDPEIDANVGRKIDIFAKTELTRTQLGADELQLLWEPNETIGVFGNATTNAEFRSSNTEAAETATFSGEVAENDNTLMAYYPYMEGATNLGAIPFTLATDQEQTGNVPALAANDLKFGQLEDQGNNKYACTFQQCFSLVKLTVNLTNCDKVAGYHLESLWLQSEGAVMTGDFTLNMSTGALSVGEATSDNVNLEFTDKPALTDEIKGWVILNPNVAAGSTINVLLTAVDENGENPITATAELETLQALEAGCAYNIPLEAEFMKFQVISLSTSEINFEANGGVETVTVTSDYEDIVATSDADWVTVEKTSDTEYAITATANESSVARTATVTFTAEDGSISQVVTIAQEGAELLEFTVSESDMTFASSSGNKYVQVTSAYTVTAASDSDEWCTVEDCGDGQFNIAVTTNTESANRSATITFTETDSAGNTQQKSVSVTQTSPETVTITAIASSTATEESVKTVRMLYTGGTVNVAINGLPGTPTITKYGSNTNFKNNITYEANSDGTYTVTVGQNSSQYHSYVLRFQASDDSSNSYYAYLCIEQNPNMDIVTYDGLTDDNDCDHLYFPLSGGTRYLNCAANIQSSAANKKIGGVTYSLLAADRDFYDLQLSSDENWVTFGDRFRSHTPITVEASSTPRETMVTFTVSDGNTTLKEKTLYIHQIDVDKDDKTANCYIVENAGTYSFDATVMGNGYKGMCNGVELDPTIDPRSVSVLWQDTEHFVSDVSLSNGTVTYTASTNEGNAVIAVADSDGAILWSWHIWGTGGKMTDITMGGTQFLPLNLGAINSSDIGLFYQGMRKDPFPSDQTDFESYITTTTATTTNANYAYTYAHPNEYLITNTSATSSGHWYNANKTVNGLSAYNAMKTLETGWGYMAGDVAKTINDPCPIGYRVPTKHDVLMMSTDDLQYLPAPITGANIRLVNGALATSFSPNNCFLWTTYSYNASYYNVVYTASTLYAILNDSLSSTVLGSACAMPVRCVKY